MSTGSGSYFNVLVTGEIESALLPGYDDLYCKYSLVSGQDWTLLSGSEDGITQQSIKTQPFGNQSRHHGPVNIWNMPVAWSLRSTNIFGWPQLALSIYGPDFMGRDVIRGYGTIHLPRKPGRHTLYIPLFTPEATTPVNGLLSYFAGKLPEFIDPKFVTRADGREVTRVTSLGAVKVTLNVLFKGTESCGYDFGK